MPQSEEVEPTDISGEQSSGKIESYPYANGEQGQIVEHDVLSTSDSDLARVQDVLRIDDAVLDADGKQKVEKARRILAQLPAANNGLILQLTGKHDYWGLVVYDDPKLIHIMEALRGPDIDTPNEEGIGMRALALVVGAFRKVTPMHEADFAIEKLGQLKLLFDSTNPSESKVFIPHARISFSDSIPGAEMGSEEKELIRSTRFGTIEPQPNGTERVDLFLHAAVKEALDRSGPYRSELWTRIKPYFAELPSLLSELEKLGLYGHGGRVQDISSYEYDDETVKKGKQAWLAIRGLVINIAQVIAEFQVNVAAVLR